MEEIVYLNSLYDYYKELLTDKQRKYFEDYYHNDLTLSEIAENNDVSRNAIHKQVRETVRILETYEGKLGLLSKNKKIIEIIKKQNNDKLLEEIERIL